MKIVKYIGSSHVRQLSMADISTAFNIDAPSDIVAVKGEPFEVSNRLADALAKMDPVEFMIVGIAGEDEPTEVAPEPAKETKTEKVKAKDE